ncbi:MAG: Holliday junction branch migration protein RuvA [Clostridia bacterium]|nr:Holliday junction branch migration protein RuvA [Clostridia bacterium]
MIYHVDGTLDYCEVGGCVIDCCGVGYWLSISDNTYSEICSHVGERTKLFTYLQVREDGVELFGFKDAEELGAFKLLITVSGVGPKAATSILSLLSPDKLYSAICSEDTKAISRANGIGAKTAARVILELHDKVSKMYFASSSSMPSASSLSGATIVKGKGNLGEALDALIVLGYARTEAQRALSGIDPTLPVEKIIPLALAKLI